MKSETKTLYEPGRLLAQARKTLEGVKPYVHVPYLTPKEAATACHLWAALANGEITAREQLDDAPENIRAAIEAASKVAIESSDKEPIC